MENNFFKSVIDADDAPVVICDLEHTIVYMNPTAVKDMKAWRSGSCGQIHKGLSQRGF